MTANQLCLFSLILILGFTSGCRFAAAENAENNHKKNEAALLKASENIEKYRKGDVQVKVVGVNGKTAKNVQLKIKQTTHDFKFGCYLKIDDLAPEKLPAYERHFSQLFNYAVVGTYWNFIENKQGTEDWSWFEREITLSRKLGMRIAAAPVLWGTNEAGTPDWLPQKKEKLLPLMKNRVQSIVVKYANAVEDWETVNEPLARKTDVFAERVGRDYVESAFLWAREAANSERLMLNEYGVFGSGARQSRNRDRYFALLEELIEKNVPLDVIGIQAHANGEWYEPANVAEQLERYAGLGKPIQVTEFSAQTLNYDDRKTPIKITGDYQSGFWNQEKQSEFYREFYTVAFGAPKVEAIVTWGLDDERAWLPGIGLTDDAGNPKPNYKILDQLINKEWRTNLQINVMPNETANFRGFFGSYQVEAVVNGETVATGGFELKKDEKNEWIIKL